MVLDWSHFSLGSSELITGLLKSLIFSGTIYWSAVEVTAPYITQAEDKSKIRLNLQKSRNCNLRHHIFHPPRTLPTCESAVLRYYKVARDKF